MPSQPCLQVHGISGSTQQQQYLLGSVSASPWNAAGTVLLALEPRLSNNKLGLGFLTASNTSTGVQSLVCAASQHLQLKFLRRLRCLIAATLTSPSPVLKPGVQCQRHA